jgi:hypothetical protein
MPVRLAEQFGVSPMTVQNVPTLRLERPIKALTRNSSILLPGALVVVGVPLRDCATNTTSKLKPLVYEVR